MAKVAPIQEDFSAGEISPRLRGKVRAPFYPNAMAFLENFEITPQGSLRKRDGSQFIKVIDEENAQLETFRHGIDEDIVIIIGTTDIQLFDRNGDIQTGTPQWVRDPTFLLEFSEWTLSFNNTNPDWEPRAISGYGYETELYTASPLVPSSTVKQIFDFNDTATTADVACSVQVFASDDNGSPRVIAGIIQVQLWDENSNNLHIEVVDLTGAVDGQIFPVSFSEPVVTQSQLELRVFSQTTGLPNNQGFKAQVSEISITDEFSDPTPVVFPSPYAVESIGNIHTAMDSGSGSLIMTCPGVPVQELTYNRASNAYAFAELVVVTNPASLWLNDAPKRCAYKDGRLWLGNTEATPGGMWGSEVWVNTNFDYIPATIVDSSPVYFPLTIPGEVQWIDGLKWLLVGSDVSEVIGRAVGGQITATDFSFPVEQTWGSAPRQPTNAGNETLFITADSSKIRSLFDGGDSVDGYDSTEATFMAEHMVRKRIRDVNYAQNPNYKLYALLSNGSFAISTYFRAIEANGWYRYTTNGEIISMTDSNDLLGTSMYQLVKRPIPGSVTGETTLMLEVNNAEPEFSYVADSYVLEKPDIITGVVTGLDHLDGYEVEVVLIDSTADNQYTVLPKDTVVAGSITLPEWSSSSLVMVGLSFTAKGTTLPLEYTNKAGTGQSQEKRYNQIYLRLIDSAVPLVNGVRPGIRAPGTLMNTSEGLFTGDTRTVNWGVNQGILEIEAPDPLPVHITAIFGNATGSST